MTLINKLITGMPFLPEQAQVCCLGSDVKLSYAEDNSLYDLPTELKVLQAWMSQQPNLTSATYTGLDALLTLLDTQCTQLQVKEPKQKASWGLLSLLGAEKSSPLDPLILQVQQLMTALQQKKKGFLNQIPSNRDDRKTVFEWIRSREYNPEISYNETEKCFEISNTPGERALLTHALKEIKTWIEQQYCFSEDPQQVKSNHFHLLSLLEVNLVHIKEKLKATQNERPLTKIALLYLSEHIYSLGEVRSREAVTPLLRTVEELLNQVVDLRLVRDRSMAPEIVLPKQAIEEISSMSLQELEEIQARVRKHKAAETLALSKAETLPLSKTASSSAERVTAPVDVFSPEELIEIHQRLRNLSFTQTVVASLSPEELIEIQQRASALKNASLEAYSDEL